jgi:hypothetical protein
MQGGLETAPFHATMTAMQRTPWSHCRAAVTAWLLTLPGLLWAVVVFEPGDGSRNASAPTGTLADSGWQWTGRFNSFCGVPVGPSSFLTAAHIGGNVGNTFEWQGRRYRTVAFQTDAASDLRLWHVSGQFASNAPVATQDLRTGEPVMILGRGATRGAEILADRGLGPVLAGWEWGPVDGLLRWGTNTVDSNIDGTTIGLYGPLVGCRFNSGRGNDEGCLSTMDSGGPLFVRRGSTWQLAAIHFAVQAAYNTQPTGNGSNGTIFDYRGLYQNNGSGWVLESIENDNPVPASFFSTRIQPRRTWLNSALATAPSPASIEQALHPDGPFQAAANAAHDAVDRLFRVPVEPGDSRFFRLRGVEGLRILRTRIEGTSLRIEYE